MQIEHKAFVNVPRQHILMLTTHGVHEWNVTPGLTDTGGQNIFVNQFSAELVQQGYKITIANRGGYPHPVTGKPQVGVVYKDQFQRIVYLEDGLDHFVRKEDMGEQVSQLASYLLQVLQDEKTQIDLMISHYWDAAVVGELFRERLGIHVTHVWVPHSLGAIKKRNIDKSHWKPLRINERIQNERHILSKVDHVASTSPLISESLQNDYGYQDSVLWLPPCVSSSRYHPHKVPDNAEVWKTLSHASGLDVKTVQRMKIITEISRTDTTKRKDVLLKAFARLLKLHPDTLLVITIDQSLKPIGEDLLHLIDTLDIHHKVAVLGSIWELLPDIYAISHIYCTPSIVEGFGMSAQEAAATGVPVVSSSRVPFASNYLYGEPAEIFPDNDSLISIGQGAILVQPDQIEGFVQALSLLLSDDQRRQVMGENAYHITIPHFTWPKVVKQFMQSLTTG